MKPKSLILILFLLTSSLFAYISGDGEEFIAKYNRHGAILISVRDPSNKLYLGKDCDALSKRYGRGFWEWANGGFIVKFKYKEFGFGRQELYIENNGKCQM